ncbi:MAG: hypothetical protein BGN84_15020 [Afipia sp. 62-7]|nr:MAG: hypothetical protein BGN84_15020 [Afipia sp. 62-7]
MHALVFSRPAAVRRNVQISIMRVSAGISALNASSCASLKPSAWAVIQLVACTPPSDMWSGSAM